MAAASPLPAGPAYGIDWRRRYDQSDPLWGDLPNQTINHASVSVTSAAVVAVTAIGAIPQLGFIHEQSGEAFALDITDLFRDTILLPAVFQSPKKSLRLTCKQCFGTRCDPAAHYCP